MRVVCFLTVFVLAGYAFGQEDPRDAERQFRFLLSRGEELQAQADNPGTDSPSAAQLRTLQRRLENEYRHFLSDHPRHTRAMVAYGSLLYDQGREEEAVDWWKKAIAIDPREAYAYNSIAGHYGHDGHAADALKLYDKAIELEPTEAIFRFNWATTCVMFRNESHAVYGWTKEEIFQRSLEQFRKARDLAPQNFELASTYAETFYMMPKPDWQEAYAAWKYCLNQPFNDSQRQLVYTHLARVSMRLGRYDEAKEWTSKLTNPGPGSLRPLLERRIAEGSKAASKSSETNSPTTSARGDGGK